MSDYTVGIHGMGWVAGAHIETFKAVDGASVTAACSRRKLDEANLKEQYGIPIKAYQEYGEMLADPDIDIIDICSPSPYHTEQAIQAARAGKDLIIEKPLALSYDDLLRLREVIKETGVNVCVCFEVRFSEQGRALNSMIQQDMVGNVHFGEVDYYHGVGPWYGQFPWNVKKEGGGSSLLTAGCHALDLLLLYMDDEVEEVTSYSTKTDNPDFEPYEYDTTHVTLLKFENGSVGKVSSVIDCLQPYYFHMHLVGSQGSILDDKFYSSKIDGLERDRWSELGVPLVDSGDVEHHPYLPQFQAYVESLDEGENMPLTDFDTAFESHRVIFAADRSAEEGRPVQLSEYTMEGVNA
jgi:predicted dehydrogenase